MAVCDFLNNDTFSSLPLFSQQYNAQFIIKIQFQGSVGKPSAGDSTIGSGNLLNALGQSGKQVNVARPICL